MFAFVKLPTGFNPPPVSRPGETRRRRPGRVRRLAFQSAPGLATGGNTATAGPCGCWKRFQSAPGLATGGNVLTPDRGYVQSPVSIRPRSRDRGKLALKLSRKLIDLRFQSAPGLATGGNISRGGTFEFRNLHVSIRPRSRDRGKPGPRFEPCFSPLVSIRPRSRDRGKRPRQPVTMRTMKFQSAPGLATGGNALLRSPGDAGRRQFQSAPGLATGGNYPSVTVTGTLAAVSIRPRSRDRGKRLPGPASPATCSRFNPPPVSRPGETCARGGGRQETRCFNPPPVSRPGETTRQRISSHTEALFQSAPGLATGGNVLPVPEPPPAPRVSIRPRSRDRGKRDRHGPSGPAGEVSIRPRSRDRGKRCCEITPHSSISGFNPPPVSRPGETASRFSASWARTSFNPPPVSRPGETLSHPIGLTVP